MDRKTFVAGVMVIATLAWLPSTASAQDQGRFYLGLGGGYGSTGVSVSEIDDAEREDSGAGYLKAGWALTDRLLIGGELNAWTKSTALDTDVEGRLNIYNVSATVTFYPLQNQGLFLKGGAGGAFLDSEVDVLGSKVSLDLGRGLGALAGAGYDIRVGRRFSITPAVNFWYGQLGDIEFADERLFSDWKHNVVDVTIGITFR